MNTKTLNDNQPLTDKPVVKHTLLGTLFVIAFGLALAAVPWINTGKFVGLAPEVRILGSVIFAAVYAKVTWDLVYSTKK